MNRHVSQSCRGRALSNVNVFSVSSALDCYPSVSPSQSHQSNSKNAYSSHQAAPQSILQYKLTTNSESKISSSNVCHLSSKNVPPAFVPPQKYANLAKYYQKLQEEEAHIEPRSSFSLTPQLKSGNTSIVKSQRLASQSILSDSKANEKQPKSYFLQFTSPNKVINNESTPFKSPNVSVKQEIQSNSSDQTQFPTILKNRAELAVCPPSNKKIQPLKITRMKQSFIKAQQEQRSNENSPNFNSPAKFQIQQTDLASQNLPNSQTIPLNSQKNRMPSKLISIPRRIQSEFTNTKVQADTQSVKKSKLLPTELPISYSKEPSKHIENPNNISKCSSTKSSNQMHIEITPTRISQSSKQEILKRNEQQLKEDLQDVPLNPRNNQKQQTQSVNEGSKIKQSDMFDLQQEKCFAPQFKNQENGIGKNSRISEITSQIKEDAFLTSPQTFDNSQTKIEKQMKEAQNENPSKDSHKSQRLFSEHLPKKLICPAMMVQNDSVLEKSEYTFNVPMTEEKVGELKPDFLQSGSQQNSIIKRMKRRNRIKSINIVKNNPNDLISKIDDNSEFFFNKSCSEYPNEPCIISESQSYQGGLLNQFNTPVRSTKPFKDLSDISSTIIKMDQIRTEGFDQRNMRHPSVRSSINKRLDYAFSPRRISETPIAIRTEASPNNNGETDDSIRIWRKLVPSKQHNCLISIEEELAQVDRLVKRNDSALNAYLLIREDAQKLSSFLGSQKKQVEN